MVLVATGVALTILFVMAAVDVCQRHDPVRRVNPVLGRIPRRLRALTEMLRLPRAEEAPFTAHQLDDISIRARTGESVSAFGSRSLAMTSKDRPVAIRLLPSPVPIDDDELRLKIGKDRTAAHTSILNYGALGFGPVNERVVRTMALAAQKANCLYNTGEDGMLDIHRSNGVGCIWQIGTGYWSCRHRDGSFDPVQFERVAAQPTVRAIELKLSQGAKPGYGGHMPKAKNTKHVAEILGVEAGTDINSSPNHGAFTDVGGLVDFLSLLASASSGKPVGVKLCVSGPETVVELLDALRTAPTVPAFFTIDGGDGGTGGAPTVLQEHAGIGALQATRILHELLSERGLREKTKLLPSGRVANGFDLYQLIRAGADGAFFVRAPVVAMGCVQARRCHVGDCPAGIATHRLWRRRGIVPAVQSERVALFHESVLQDLRHLMRASGHATLRQLRDS